MYGQKEHAAAYFEIWFFSKSRETKAPYSLWSQIKQEYRHLVGMATVQIPLLTLCSTFRRNGKMDSDRY